jgi:hypothetical protein
MPRVEIEKGIRNPSGDSHPSAGWRCLEVWRNLGAIWGQLRFLYIPQTALLGLGVTCKLLILQVAKPSHGGGQGFGPRSGQWEAFENDRRQGTAVRRFRYGICSSTARIENRTSSNSSSNLCAAGDSKYSSAFLSTPLKTHVQHFTALGGSDCIRHFPLLIIGVSSQNGFPYLT